MAMSNADYQKRWRDARREERNLLANREAAARLATLVGAEREDAEAFLTLFGPARFIRAAKRADALKARAAHYEAEAEAHIAELHGVKQNVAIQQLVTLGARKFVEKEAQAQRKLRLKELREGSAEKRELGPVALRVRAMRAAKGYKD